jgi:hypothetical protein
MTSKIITNNLVEKVMLRLETETGFRKEDISYEIQDDFQFLLISISVDDFVGADRVSTFKRVSHLLNQLIPGRKGDYSWMVNFTSDGKIIDSYFGGDLDSPESGL